MRADQSIFERAGLASGLLTEDQIDHAWHVLVESMSAADLSLEEITDEQLAAELVELGHLNHWQAEQLRQGRTKFTLGAYRILDAIGHGGMGWVFKGEHVLLGRIEAIKVLPTEQTDPTSIANFRREIRAQAQLDHPNLVRLSYADTDGDTYFLVTEYVPGSDLRRLVRYQGALSEEKAAILGSQAAEALQYVHGRGLIHRDVKPGNLLITPEGRTKLTDLGLAFFSSDAESPVPMKPRHIVGTADFLAPEIVVSPSEVRSISDIYSLGCTLYYAVTGKVPFPGGETAEKLRRQLEETPISAHRLNSNLSDEFIQVIEAMMQKRPADRMATAAEVVELLRPWVESAQSDSWQAIGTMARDSGERALHESTLADTVSATFEPAETHAIGQSKTGPAAFITRACLPQGELSTPAPAVSDEDIQPGLGRGTTALLALAMGIALAVMGLLVFNS